MDKILSINTIKNVFAALGAKTSDSNYGVALLDKTSGEPKGLMGMSDLASVLGGTKHVYFQKQTTIAAEGNLNLPVGSGFLMYDIGGGTRGNMYYMTPIGAIPIYQSNPQDPESSVVYLGERFHFAIHNNASSDNVVSYIFFSLGNFV